MGPSRDVDVEDGAGNGPEDPLVRAILAAVDRAVAERSPAERARLLADVADAGRALLDPAASPPMSVPATDPTDATTARIASTLALMAAINDGRGSGRALIGQVLARVDELAESHHQPV